MLCYSGAMANEKTETVTVYVTSEEKQHLRVAAATEGFGSLSSYLRATLGLDTKEGDDGS